MPTRFSNGGRTELLASLYAAQEEIGHPAKDSKNDRHKFVSITATLEAVRPVLSRHELAIIQRVDEPLVDDDVTWLPLTTLLCHSGGGYIENVARIPVDMSGVMMNPAQAVGSAIAYLRRYAIRSILGLEERNDGELDQAPQRTEMSVTPAQYRDDPLRRRGCRHETGDQLVAQISGLQSSGPGGSRLIEQRLRHRDGYANDRSELACYRAGHHGWRRHPSIQSGHPRTAPEPEASTCGASAATNDSRSPLRAVRWCCLRPSETACLPWSAW